MQHKSMLLLGLALLAVFSFTGAKMSNNAPIAAEPGVISVSGEAEVRIMPDEVILRLGIETSDKNLSKAKQLNDQIVTKVQAVAKRYSIPAEHVQTDYLNIEPRYNDGYAQREFVGYVVHKTVVITLRDLTKFEDVLSALLESGVNYVHGIEFRTTDLRKYRDQARELALQAAREKATAMAAALNQKIGEPRSIQEEANSWWSGYGSGWWGRWGGMTQNVVQEVGGDYASFDSSLAPGQISVTARVAVSFAMTAK
ncbi:MAG TPA: SIMPL domain-containing protein [Anaerolineae bacterium]|nr:SIMPL domain-containing protein [Anaerolineae bacterium]HQK12718.1 SIMPL domain-containing protein [Anaerolineae bacterium]